MLALMLAPPAGSWSVAVHGRTFGRGQDAPWGAEGSGANCSGDQKVYDDNQIMRASLALIRAAHALRIPWNLEHPDTSIFWSTPEARALARDQWVHTHTTDLCRYGARWRKRTRFMCGHVLREEADGRFRGICYSRHICLTSGRPHWHLQGRTAQGVPWTKVAQTYPQQLAHQLAALLVSEARMKRANEYCSCHGA